MLDVHVLAAKLDAIKGIVERLEDRAEEDREEGDRRHHENVAAIEGVRGEWRKTNGRVTRLESAKVWLPVIGATVGVVWFVLTVVLNFQRVP